jgi:hypothetical protein
LTPNTTYTRVGKTIQLDGTITQYSKVTYWFQSVARMPATVSHLFAYLCEARKRNIFIIRGYPANIERQPTLRQLAGLYKGDNRGDHGFNDTPTKLLPLDIDKVPIKWLADPERAVKSVVAQLGEPWASASFVWFLSPSYGLETKDSDTINPTQASRSSAGQAILSMVRCGCISFSSLNAHSAKTRRPRFLKLPEA